jgi:hypothetical protein
MLLKGPFKILIDAKRPGRTAGHYEQNNAITPHGVRMPANAMPV